MDGILLVDKPDGWTSHDVVAKIRGILATETRNREQETGHFPSSKLPVPRESKIRVGHTGTLDPFATGLLILVIGSYTKRAGEFSKLDKTYEAEFTLGFTSSTGDPEGEIVSKSGIKPTQKAIRQVLSQFEGQIDQTPHAYSAVKIDGQRAYKLARQGKEVALEPRKVTIYSISDVKYTYPKLLFTVKVSSGTYIRSLAEDIGEKLGTGAYLSSLRRTKVDKFSIRDGVSMARLGASDILSSLTRVEK